MRKPRVGKQVLEIVTSGMYSHPLMVLREYVQNSADAIDEAIDAGILTPRRARIDVILDGTSRTIEITDNGIGVPLRRIGERLCGCGITTKRQNQARGFRGIGRLGGLGYCEAVQFETRSAWQQKVAVVTWDAKKLRDACQERDGQEDAAAVLKRVVRVGSRPARPSDGAHFFRVTLRDVHRFHTDALMNEIVVAEYLGRVGPVPFDVERFRFAQDVEAHLSAIDGYRTYTIRVNGIRIYRPHSHLVPVSGKSSDRVTGVELFDIKGRDGGEIGRGWYARMNYIASIPPRVGMRGVRVRQGNIEVGDEHFLADWFTERRFASWHVGEIHLGYRLKANARRDGFEQSSDYEAFLEHAHSLGKYLSHLCRTAAKNRSQNVAARRMLDKAEALLRPSFFLDEDHIRQAIETAESMFGNVERLIGNSGDGSALRERLQKTKRSLRDIRSNTPCLHDILDGRSVTHCTPKVLLATVAKGIVTLYGSHRSAESLATAVLRPYLTARGRRLSSFRSPSR